MNKTSKILSCFLLLIFTFSQSSAQEEGEQTDTATQVLTQKGYDKGAPAVAKLIADEGRRIGAGVIVAIDEKAGYILTSYNMVAGREKVAVVLKNYADPLLGFTVDKWIDFDSDLAIIEVKNFPKNQPTVTLQTPRLIQAGQVFTILGHTDVDDWTPIPVNLLLSNERNLIFDELGYEGVEGAPVLNEDGNMVGLVTSIDQEIAEDSKSTQAVKSNVIKPLIKDWFQESQLQRKWSEAGNGIATWIWAVGGGVLGGGIATSIAILGGGTENPQGLPRPPDPPGN